MIQIVSGIDPKTGGYNSKIRSSHKGTENFMYDVILNGKAITGGSIFYSIHFVDQYFVFSKNKIVRDPKGTDRFGCLSFSIAGMEIKDIFKEIYLLENKYNNDNLGYKQENDKENVTGNFKKDGLSVFVYYENKDQLKKYFLCDNSYKKYKIIFFIEENFKEKKKESNPLKSISYDRKTTFDELQKKEYIHTDTPKSTGDITSQTVIQNKEMKSYWNKFTQISVIVIFILNILLIIGGWWGYQNLSSKSADIENKQIFKLNQSITTLNNQIGVLQNKVQSLEVSIINHSKQLTVPQKVGEKAVKEEDGSKAVKTDINSNTNEQLSDDMKNFLQLECKNMTLYEINKKINGYSNWTSFRSLNGFAYFVTLIGKNPPAKSEITAFINNYQLNLNASDFEYVKFVKYLSLKEDAFFDKSTKSIRNIKAQTLQVIEKKYQYEHQ